MATNPAQGMTPQQIAQLYSSPNYKGVFNQVAGSNSALFTAMQSQQSLAASQWVFDGVPCTIAEFAERCFGDSAERDIFLLKYTKIGELD